MSIPFMKISSKLKRFSNPSDYNILSKNKQFNKLFNYIVLNQQLMDYFF